MEIMRAVLVGIFFAASLVNFFTGNIGGGLGFFCATLAQFQLAMLHVT
jgi:hypothetical protein